MRLQIDPKLWRSTKISGEPECGISGDAPATKHDIIDARAWYFDDLRQGVNADLHRLQEIIPQNFTGMNWRKPSTAGYVCKVDPPCIQIFALDAHRIILCGSQRFRLPMHHFAPPETEPPLIVNADAMLTASIPVQGFEAIAGRDP